MAGGVGALAHFRERMPDEAYFYAKGGQPPHVFFEIAFWLGKSPVERVEFILTTVGSRFKAGLGDGDRPSYIWSGRSRLGGRLVEDLRALPLLSWTPVFLWKPGDPVDIPLGGPEDEDDSRTSPEGADDD